MIMAKDKLYDLDYQIDILKRMIKEKRKKCVIANQEIWIKRLEKSIKDSKK